MTACLTADNCLLQFCVCVLLLSETQARASVCIAEKFGNCFDAVMYSHLSAHMAR